MTWVKEARKRKDPIAFEPGGVFGPRSQFFELDREVKSYFEVQKLVVEKYSLERVDDFSSKVQWYTPICIIRTETGKLFQHKGTIILIRDPFKFDRLIRQFEMIGLAKVSEGLWLDIIETDREFDSLISSCMNLEVGALIDPQMDAKGNLHRAIVIQPMPVDEREKQSLFEFTSKADRSN